MESQENCFMSKVNSSSEPLITLTIKIIDMKKVLIQLTVIILFFVSCVKHDDPDPETDANIKIDVCHREGNGSSHIINISIDAWPAHQAHGDVRLDDQDDDGFVPNNNCGFGQMGDCNDLNPAIRPGAIEVCGNNIDENCNGQINESCP